MDILGADRVLVGVYGYADETQKRTPNGVSFAEQLQGTNEVKGASKADAYRKYLGQKYGHVVIQNVGKDQQSLDKVRKNMNGSTVVIAPDILAEMADRPEKAVYYEGKIDDFFHALPGLKASFAAQGLDHQPCGVVIHADGRVTYIGGCGDTPERVVEVAAINKAKRERKAAEQRRLQMRRITYTRMMGVLGGIDHAYRI